MQRKIKRQASLFLMLILALTLVLVGCSDKGSSATSSGGSKDKSGSGGAAKPLVIGLSPAGQWQENFNPFSPNATGGTNGLIYQPLYYLDPISGKDTAMLATKYEWTNDNKTLVATLRDNVKWSDGEAFTADDVVFTFDLLKKYPAADSNGIWKEVSSVKKQSDNQVAFNFDQANVPFESYILGTDIVPQHIWKDLGDPSKAKVTKPVGTGPYLLESFTPQLYKMKANPDFYDGEYAVKELQFPAYSGNDSEQLALTKGELDWAGIFIPDADKVYVSADKDHNKYWFPASNNVTLYPNLTNPLLKDVNVRKAISLAIDRQKLSDQAASGYDPLPSTTALLLPRDEKWIDPSIPEDKLKFELNQDKAVKTLEDAGYKKGSDGIFVSPDGKKLSFTLQTVSGWTDWATMAQLISQELKAIGIEIKVQQPEQAAYTSNVQGGKYELAISWTNSGPDPFKQYQDMLNSHGGWNLEKWNDPKTDAALKQFQGTTDEGKQKEAINYLQNVMVDNMPVIPLVNGPVWYEYRTANYTGWPTEDNAYANPAPFNWPAPAIVLSKLKPAN
ncbi:peptide/nickel transport system substrate-binding protein [Pullulanibacillus pueri]|uniref:Peptide ABC transporter substrate-binding protein n=1 Tax=Pullulanibacillus pueri TaxID=1437324 RepID=A0A8J2ZZZ5_9BACL|nr:ABC transporter substrate-binding protein [Pullulanibacillus pueri]MBM7680480.1 peptide/nickel transport system substrate-binding protein [Pullulanibacillus pueri]GGH88193.1 peptide ABC transporter substrate-binding protein [Pullulanibacillus pueri]